MNSFLQDLRYAIRLLVANPGFSIVAVLTLALGIGANTAVFNVINTIMLQSLPVSHPEELYLFGAGRSCCMISGVARQYDLFSNPQYLHFRSQAQSTHFEDVAAFSGEQFRVLVKHPESSAVSAETMTGKLVSGNYFSVLGAPALLGRALSPHDDSPGAPPAMVINFRYWVRKFSRSPGAVGSTLNVNNAVFTIVGVMPPDFFGEELSPTPPEAWFPLVTMPQITFRPESVMHGADMRWLRIIGRAKPGFTISQAQAALTTQLRQFLIANPDPHAPSDQSERIQRAIIVPTPAAGGVAALRTSFSDQLKLLFAMVGLVLLIACANIANLLLAKATSRQREIWIRLALGSSRWRLVRQLITESMLLALLGGVAGVFLAIAGAHGLLALMLRGRDNIGVHVTTDVRVLLFLIGVSLVAGCLFGLVPALRASRYDLAQQMRARTQVSLSPLGAGRRFGLGRLLITGQVAISLLLIAGAGLLVRTLVNLVHQDLGFDPEHVLLLHIDPKIAGYKQNQLDGLYRNMLDRINALPGVRSSAVTLYTPLSDTNWASGIVIPGYHNGRKQGASWTRVSPGFFDTLQIPVVSGRVIGPQDTPTSAKVAVVNQTMAKRFWPAQDPIGKRFGWDAAHSNELEVIGIAKDVKHQNLRDEEPAMFWLPMTQRSGDQTDSYADVQSQFAQDLIVRAAGEPGAITTEVREALHSVDKNLPIVDVTTMAEQRDYSSGYEQMMALLASLFGALALLLASVGLYGVMAYSVARRTSEIGVRMALGAARADVLWMVMREIFLTVGLGIAAGVPLALAVSRTTHSLLFGVSPNDPLTIVLAVGVLGVVASSAGYIAARRATQVDPMVALRSE